MASGVGPDVSSETDHASRWPSPAPRWHQGTHGWGRSAPPAREDAGMLDSLGVCAVCRRTKAPGSWSALATSSCVLIAKSTLGTSSRFTTRSTTSAGGQAMTAVRTGRRSKRLRRVPLDRPAPRNRHPPEAERDQRLRGTHELLPQPAGMRSHLAMLPRTPMASGRRLDTQHCTQDSAFSDHILARKTGCLEKWDSLSVSQDCGDTLGATTGAFPASRPQHSVQHNDLRANDASTHWAEVVAGRHCRVVDLHIGTKPKCGESTTQDRKN